MSIQCCTEEGKLLRDTELQHPVCLPIEIPEDDPFYSKFSQHCMSFVRSIPAPRSDCRLGHGEQVKLIGIITSVRRQTNLNDYSIF